MTAPIFIFSLPRSGSTLAQKVISSHDDVATTAEPWVLLPFIYSLRDEGIYTEYAQRTGAKAIKEFIQHLPSGQADYYAAIREFALRLYNGTSGENVRYFLDKTPRYHLVAKEILNIFPDAKCILIWRNPLAVAASMVETWGRKGRWIAYRYKVDLYKGLESLIEISELLPQRFIQVRYEDMVFRPGDVWPRIFSYLDLNYDPVLLERYRSVQFAGSMGDPTGHEKYRAISQDSVNAWIRTFNTPLRKAWARRYLNWIGSKRLSAMGYDKAALEQSLASYSSVSVSRLLSDALFMTIGTAHAPLDLSGVKRQVLRGIAGKRCYAAT